MAAVISLSQYLFLLPVVRLRPPDGTRSKSLSGSLRVGALLAAINDGTDGSLTESPPVAPGAGPAASLRAVAQRTGGQAARGTLQKKALEWEA